MSQAWKIFHKRPQKNSNQPAVWPNKKPSNLKSIRITTPHLKETKQTWIYINLTANPEIGWNFPSWNTFSCFAGIRKFPLSPQQAWGSMANFQQMLIPIYSLPPLPLPSLSPPRVDKIVELPPSWVAKMPEKRHLGPKPRLEGRWRTWATTSYTWSYKPYISRIVTPVRQFTREFIRRLPRYNSIFSNWICRGPSNQGKNGPPEARLLLRLFGSAHLLHWADNQLLQAIKPEIFEPWPFWAICATQRLKTVLPKQKAIQKWWAVSILPKVWKKTCVLVHIY